MKKRPATVFPSGRQAWESASETMESHKCIARALANVDQLSEREALQARVALWLK